MSHPKLTLPQVLCNIGRKLSGAEECLAVEEAISTLDKVRLAAFTGNLGPISNLPPLLGTDSMIPSDLFLYSDSCQARIHCGPHNIHEVRGIHVVGGAMMQTKACAFPVSILYSDVDGEIVLHAGNVPIAKLEAEFYDSAFHESDPWAEYIMGAEANEFAQWRREAATGVRKFGLCSIPPHLISGDCYRIVRKGITPFLSLRSPEHEAEFLSIRQRLADDLAVLPKGVRDLMKTYSRHRSIKMTFIGCSAARFPPKSEIVEPPLEERMRSADALLESNPVLSWTSSIILHCARDDAFDQQGDAIGEHFSGLTYNTTHERAIDESKSNERSFLVRARNNKTTDIQNEQIAGEAPFTLTAVMKDLNRSYTTKSICDLANTDSKVVMETVAREIYDVKDANMVAESCASNTLPNMTPTTAVTVLGKCLPDHQGLVIANRDPDGRISNAKLVGFQIVVPRLSKDSLARLLLFPWVTVLFVDTEHVSVLLIKDLVHVESSVFNREQLQLRESAKPRGAASDYALKSIIEELRQEVASLKSENSAAISSIREFQKKLNFLVEKKATGDINSTASDAVPEPPLAIAPPVAKSTTMAEDSDVVKSLKRTLATLKHFAEKRRRV